MLFNTLLLLFYTVVTFKTHSTCANTNEADDDLSATDLMTIALTVGFGANFVDFIVTSFDFNLLFFETAEGKSDLQKNHSTLAVVAKWVMPGLIIAVSIFQEVMRGLGVGKECFATGVLNMENTWLQWLIVAQLYRVVFFSLWRLLADYFET